MSLLGNKQNIILIGMPGAGKSTIGVVLAKNLGFQFLDSDLCIQEKEDRLLHEIISSEGIEGFLEIENRVNASIAMKHCVIATGGSAVYGKDAMTHFKQDGIIIYLKLPFFSIEERLGDLNKRGVAIKDGQTLKSIYDERIPLYEKYADITIDCQDMQIKDIVTLIANSVMTV